MSAPSIPSRTRQGQDYLAAVEHELADLAPDDRSALLEDLAAHLEAVAVEADDRNLTVRLGQPAAYAAELRAAAGLPARGASSTAGAPGLRERVDRIVGSDAYQRALPALREVRRLGVELQPAWWVLRGYLLVLVLSLLDGDGGYGFPVPAVLGSRRLGLLLVLAAVAGSVVLGRRMRQGPPLRTPVRVLVTGGGVLLALVSLGAWDRGRADSSVVYDYAAMAPEQAIGEFPLLSRSGPVTDVFPYAADGTPLEGVLLYDQDGRPLQVGFQEWWADECARVLEQPLAADGVPVPHSFPQNYVLDPAGVDLSRSVSRPAASCVADLPRPDVPLPVFAASDGTGAAPATPSGGQSPEAEQSVAPAPGD